MAALNFTSAALSMFGAELLRIPSTAFLAFWMDSLVGSSAARGSAFIGILRISSRIRRP